ncbi:IclR family transcriptional regulator C-terminal domain-containing protein [Streptomyces sp. NPDC006670]|uniref:IclR family transcriptional regulator domain-containing protein n=1 Tax=Streptomyces sp. NPDC006670 TaxID=3154476 RepID=UPI0033D28947
MKDRQMFQTLEDFFAVAPITHRYQTPDIDYGTDAVAGRRPRTPAHGVCALQRTLQVTQTWQAAVPVHALTWIDPRLDHVVDAQEAAYALDQVCAAVALRPEAARRLDRLVTIGPSDWVGALVFACLLHLLGHEGARFWWQFAAAADSDAAAYCLFLDHARDGEYDDAELWATQLAERDFEPQLRWGRPARLRRTTLPDNLHDHVLDYEDDFLGAIPTPGRQLAAAIRNILRPPAAKTRASRTLAAPSQPTLTDWTWPAPPRPAPANPPSPSREPADDALNLAHQAADIVNLIETHPLGITISGLARRTSIPHEQLTRLLDMLVEEEFAIRLYGSSGVHTPGPALARLAMPGGTRLQIQHTLNLARDTVGAAVYFSRYVDGEVTITQMADGPITPAVHEWVDFRFAAHASAVGKCLLTQLEPDLRLDHLARHKTARLTRRTITNPKALVNRLDRLAPNEPVYDLHEYSLGTVCAAVAINTGAEPACLALSLPHGSAHRLREATAALAAKAVPVLLTLLLSGALPADAPAAEFEDPLIDTTSNVITHAGLSRLHNVFRTPLVAGQPASPAPTPPAAGPHLATEPAGDILYLFGTAPATPLSEQLQLVLPHTYATPAAGTEPQLPHAAPALAWPEQACADERLLVFST